jgi:hypothetical protein
LLFEAIADDGPLAGDPNLTVETPDGKWPHMAIWADDGGRHEYRLKHPPEERSMAAAGAIPIYLYVRTLDVDEQ